MPAAKLRSIFAVAFAVVAALVCIRLGFWQLDRREQRVARNALLEARMESAVVPVEALPADTGRARWRRASIAGRYDFANELVLTSRSRDGSPGVRLITPVRIPGRDTAVLVDRGWVYSPDGFTVDLERWREPETVTDTGLVEPIAAWGSGPLGVSSNRRAVRRLDPADLATRLPYPVARVSLTLLAPADGAVGTSGDADGGAGGRGAAGGSPGSGAGGSPESAARPARMNLPRLDEGPHLGYAIQWFSFAAIAVIGVTLLLWQERRSPTARQV